MKLELEISEQRMKALRVQLIETAQGVILRRGRVQVQVDGDRAVEILQTVLSAAADGVTIEAVYALFAGSDRATIQSLVEELIAKKILVPITEAPTAPESPQDILYWHFGAQTKTVLDRINHRRIAIVGVNYVAHQLVSTLQAAGFANIQVIDYQLLSNLLFFDDDDRLTDKWHNRLTQPTAYKPWLSQLEDNLPDCLVVTSDFGGLQLMRLWNRFCVQRNIHFLPVVLQDFIGYVGPLVIPRETACFECLRARQNSHLERPDLQRVAEANAFEGQTVSGFHPAMASILGDIAALELTRFYGEWMSPRIVGTLIEVNLLRPQLQPRKVLKLPRCQVCSSLNQHATVSLNQHTFMPGHAVKL
jgi:molybdopterin-synthase adenylyltransferase